MRETGFRAWLGKRGYKGAVLSKKSADSRLRRAKRIERALCELGFEQGTFDEVHAIGRWSDLTTALKAVASDWRGHETAARRRVVHESGTYTASVLGCPFVKFLDCHEFSQRLLLP